MSKCPVLDANGRRRMDHCAGQSQCPCVCVWDRLRQAGGVGVSEAPVSSASLLRLWGSVGGVESGLCAGGGVATFCGRAHLPCVCEILVGKARACLMEAGRHFGRVVLGRFGHWGFMRVDSD